MTEASPRALRLVYAASLTKPSPADCRQGDSNQCTPTPVFLDLFDCLFEEDGTTVKENQLQR